VIGLTLLALLAAGPSLDDSGRAQWVKMRWDARTRSCGAQAGGVEVGDPASDEGRAALLRALPDKQVRVQVRGIDDGVPYACVDKLVSALQEEGYRGVTLGSPSPGVRR
jgi:hypothetical protein